MDCYRNVFTSLDHFRDELRSVLYRAQRNLERDDGLVNVALLTGRRKHKELAFLGAHRDTINAILKKEASAGSYESVIFITLAAVAMDGDRKDGVEAVFRSTSRVEDLGPLRTLCVVVEGSHRDFGTHAVHLEFSRQGENRFTFGRSEFGTLKGGIVEGLWPKRTLN